MIALELITYVHTEICVMCLMKSCFFAAFWCIFMIPVKKKFASAVMALLNASKIFSHLRQKY